jgi:signal transduction histidine kinase
MAVRDQGPGLPEPSAGGRIGLGLSIVTQIAEAHGGQLGSFPGEDGGGTTMVVWLPTAETSGPVPTRAPLADV